MKIEVFKHKLVSVDNLFLSMQEDSLYIQRENLKTGEKYSIHDVRKSGNIEDIKKLGINRNSKLMKIKWIS